VGGGALDQACHQRVSVIAGVSQLRTARSALGQLNAGGMSRHARGCWTGRRCPLSCGLSGVGPGGGSAVSQVFQQKENAQLTSTWWRRIAMSERTWKSAQPSSGLRLLPNPFVVDGVSAEQPVWHLAAISGGQRR